MHFTKKEKQTAIKITLIFMALGVAVQMKSYLENTVLSGYLVRSDYGGSAYTADLVAETENGKKEISIEVEARQYTDEEIENFLDEAENGLEELILDGQSPDHISKDLELTESYPNFPVKISWLSENPGVISYEGRLTDQIPEEGEEAVLEATLSCQGKERYRELAITVFPKEKTESEEFQDAVGESLKNQDASSEKVYLPDEVEGSKVKWTSDVEKSGFVIIFLGIVAAGFYLLNIKKKAEEKEEKRFWEMNLDYPSIISKMMVLLRAGLSMRNTFFRMADDYKKEFLRDGRRREGFEVICQACRDMEQGIPEEEAYRRIGINTPAIYKTFSVLIVQNLRLGGRELLRLLERESENAQEERKKQARILGEQASSKLLFPMMGLLVIVFIILIVPAFVSVG